MELLSTIVNLLLMTFRLSIPIALAAIGVSISERSGVINLGIEGIMLLGAMGAVVGSHIFGSALVGLIVALITGVAVGGLYALCVLYFKANQSVIGIGLNSLAAGLTVVTVKSIWNKEGISGTVDQLGTFTLPLLNRIPVVGAMFSDQSPLIIASLFIALFAAYVLAKTKIGLRLTSIGEHPLAAATAGIPVTKYRTFAIVVGSALAALGGAYLSVVHSNLFVNNMVAGRGFMAIAANILGGWNPIGALLASLLFAFTQALRFQFSYIQMPEQISQIMPYVITLLVLVGIGRKAKSPAKLGVL
ncbi:ABC transporter permease [Pleomorphochaeta sp. DL1XJH-081]|jgi:simple sugar transport system permease protein|uniref:ABC transporter permease n=1 Tax=Pleomorphochaeta sp. DL1XJH-081 TaxID=3409690 RepID=UPI003BB5D2C1